MSEHVYDEPGIIRNVQCDQNNKENIVDIYLSVESLKVYENPWVEDVSANIPGPAEAQHPVSVVSESSGKRNHVRTCSVFLAGLCLLLLVGIIYIGVKMNKDKTYWDAERSRLTADNNHLRKTTDQLTADNTELSRQRNILWMTFCKIKINRKKCENLLDLPSFDQEEDQE